MGRHTRSFMASVEFQHVSKHFGQVPALEELSLQVNDGEFLVLVGPSGCGKSTALRLVAGLEEASSGEIRISGRRVNEESPQQRNIAMVFQNYALYPHKTVRKNLEFPLKMMRLTREERARRVEQAARLLDLGPLLERRPRELSGGQRQRVAMGRALVRDPQVFLLDEPLSNLDAKLRVSIRAQVAELQRELGITTIYVTHDQVEAMTLGDRVAVLHAGRLQQLAPAQELYDQPANIMVATFIGSPRMNVFRSRLSEAPEGGLHAALGARRLRLPNALAQARPALRRDLEREIFCGLRPEAFRRAATGEATLDVQVETVEALGHEQVIYFRLPGVHLYQPETEPTQARETGQDDVLTRQAEMLAARLPSHPLLHRGDAIGLAADATQMHLFDERGDRL